MVKAQVRCIGLAIAAELTLSLFPASVLADIALERGPTSQRGSVAGAVVAWGCAVFVIASALLRHLSHTGRARAGSAPLAADDERESHHHQDMRAAELTGRVRSIGLGLLQFGVGALLIAGIATSLQWVLPQPVLPQGWTTIRPPYETTALAVQGEVVWAGGRSGLVAIERLTGRLQAMPPGCPRLRHVKDLLVDRNGNLWIAHGSGLTRYAADRWQTFSTADGMLSGAATALCEDRDGALWIGTEQGVVRYYEQRWRAFTTSDGLEADSVDVIFQDRDGVMWFGSGSTTRGGLSSYDGKTWQAYSTSDGLAHNSVNAIVQDREGALWFGTGFGRQGGATRLFREAWTTWSRQDGLAGEKVRSIFQDSAGRLWFGSEYDGMAVCDSSGKIWRLLTPREGLAGWEVKKMVQDHDGVYWLGTENGVTRIAKFDWPAPATAKTP
jgi:ligand-binding sensor domain-containing protein